MNGGIANASHLDTALWSEIGDRAYGHWWLAEDPGYLKAWWPR